MSEEIFDYFGGNSPRKVEPLDESEMFDDLLPKPEAEPEPPVAAANIEPAAEVDAAGDPLPQEFDEIADAQPDQQVAQAADSDVGESADQQQPQGAHWDDLASSLGLEPARSSAKDKPGRSRREHRTEEPALTGTGNEPTEGKSMSNEPPISQPSSVSQSDDPIAEARTLEDMFEPVASDSSESSGAVDEPFDEDDPFAAFSGAGSSDDTGRDDDFDDIEAIEEEESIEDEEPISDSVEDGFVEFEVKDLSPAGRQPHGERSQRRGRGRRSEQSRGERSDSEQRERGGGRSRSRKRSDAEGDRNRRAGRGRERGSESTGERDRELDRDRKRDSAEEPTPRNRRSSGRKSERGDSQLERSESKRPRRSRTEEAETRSQGRGRDRETAEYDDGDDRKKPKIPTWDEAISGVIEKNMKRQGQKSGRGGGGGRRRRS